MKEVPNIMRALGFYPTQEEIQCLFNEISYFHSKQAEAVEFNDFIKRKFLWKQHN